MKSKDAEVKNSILTTGGEKKSRNHRIGEIKKKNSTNICEEKIRAIHKGSSTLSPREKYSSSLESERGVTRKVDSLSDVNPLFDEMLEDIECKDYYASNLDESNFLVTPLPDYNEEEYFAPGDDIQLLLHHDPSTLKMSVASILEGFTDEPPLKENDDLFDLESKENKWKKILYDAPIDDLMTEDKIFDPGIHD
uniref:Uncharacterized protein n=1 Tax=Tanacetum cinerariifolium TaxID=118510 RepID=A0A699IXI6_TANCI|nr:hypothetical protein [Tanacetum cinerariifolium]GEZ93863.1 hypothetical protein [Tanacetum cinerariifolium]